MVSLFFFMVKARVHTIMPILYLCVLMTKHDHKDHMFRQIYSNDLEDWINLFF